MSQERSHDPEVAVSVAAMSRTDEELAQAASQSPNAFAQLYHRHVTNVYRYLLVRVGTVHDAQDLTTQTFLAALRNIASYQGVGKFRSWLLGIARRKVADYFRQRRETLPLEMAEQVPHTNVTLEEYIDRQLRLEMVAQMLHELSPERAEALALRLFGQLSVAEVAQVMGKSEAAIKMLIYRAISQLQQRLDATQKED